MAILTSLVGGVVWDDKCPDSTPSSTGAALLTGAEVLGSIAGLLFAAMVFGVQFHAERLGHASFLVRYLARREGIVPIAAFTLSVIGANMFVGVLTTRAIPTAASIMALIDLILVPIVFLLTTWLIFRLVAVTSGDFFEQSLKPGLAWEYQRGLDDELHRAALLRIYEHALADAGIAHNSLAAYSSFRNEAASMIVLRRHGSIRDVDLLSIRELGILLQRQCPDRESVVTVAPYDNIHDATALVLRARRDGHGYVLPCKPLAESAKAQIEDSLSRVFVIAPAIKRDLVDSLSRFHDTIVSYARYDRPDQLKRALDVYEHLIEQRFQRELPEGSNFTHSFERLPDFLSGFGYYELAQGAANSGDKQTVEVVLAFAVRVMGLAITYQHSALLRAASGLVEAVYWNCYKLEGFQPWLGHTVDKWINHIFQQFRIRKSKLLEAGELARVVDELPLLKGALAWVLHLLKMALENDQVQDAQDFLDRIGPDDRQLAMGAVGDEHRAVADALLAESALYLYVTTALVGWCVQLTRAGKLCNGAIPPVFRRCVLAAGTRENLIWAWENVTKAVDGDCPINAQLGIEYWHEPGHRWRTGVPSPVLTSESWLPDGFIALSLALPTARGKEMPEELARPPMVGYDLALFEAKANALIEDNYIREQLLQLDDVHAKGARDQFMQLLRGRVCMAKRLHLDCILAAPVSEHRVHEVRQQVITRLGEYRMILGVVAQLGGLDKAAIATIDRPAWIRMPAAKINYLEGERGSTNHAEILAEMVARQEDAQLAHEVESSAMVIGVVTDLDDLHSWLSKAIAELRGRGCTPSLILVPYHKEVLTSLCGEEWHVLYRTIPEYGGARFEGVPLRAYPYGDSKSIAVVDVARFFGKADVDLTSTLQLNLDASAYEHENHALVAKAGDESDPAEIADSFDVQVSVELIMPVGAGTCDKSAATSVILDVGHLGFAFRKDSNQYHRPNCIKVANATNLERVLDSRYASNLGEREPCPICRPNGRQKEESGGSSRTVCQVP